MNTLILAQISLLEPQPNWDLTSRTKPILRLDLHSDLTSRTNPKVGPDLKHSKAQYTSMLLSCKVCYYCFCFYLLEVVAGTLSVTLSPQSAINNYIYRFWRGASILCTSTQWLYISNHKQIFDNTFELKTT